MSLHGTGTVHKPGRRRDISGTAVYQARFEHRYCCILNVSEQHDSAAEYVPVRTCTRE